MRDSALNYVDLFAGAGGLSLGFCRAGYTCLGAIEIDPQASASYKLNFPGHVGAPFSRFGPEEGNILQLSTRDLEKICREHDVDDVDVVVGGPPCQGFSRVGRGKLDSLAKTNGAFRYDPRNRLYLKFLEFVEILRPKSFLFENVAGLLHLRGTNIAETICKEASKLGYRVLCTILNAAWFGVPQTRERVFILGVRSDLAIEPSFPEPIYRADLTRGHLTGIDLSEDLFENRSYFRKTSNPPLDTPPAIAVEMAIGDLPPFTDHLSDPRYRAVRTRIRPEPYLQGRPNFYATLMRCWGPGMISSEVRDHFCRATPRDYRIFGNMKPGDKYPRAVEIAEELFRNAEDLYQRGLLSELPLRKNYIPPYSTKTFDEKWRKLLPHQPSWTITAHLAKDTYSHIHYDSQQSRSITIREAARLQSFPDAFLLAGNMGDCFRQIGNAVPPLLAFRLASHIRSFLRDRAAEEPRFEAVRIAETLQALR